MRQTDIGPLFRRTGAIGLGTFVGVGGNLQASGDLGLGSPPVHFCLFREHGNGRPRGAVMGERPPSGLLCKIRHAARSVVGGWPHVKDQARCVAPVMVGWWDGGWLMLAPIRGRLGRLGRLAAICARNAMAGKLADWKQKQSMVRSVAGVFLMSPVALDKVQIGQRGRVPGSGDPAATSRAGRRAGMNLKCQSAFALVHPTLIPSSLILIQT
ncbi:hypothetical protein F5144DRAFT_200345 [Chaetomium tenue]|uniref:Uncharacterized protein n=1 Tax=Chaetomium tenue TaxID=1854479 RepID=A0ACB7PHS9_9PEZI|nr:hypothetical protein F5144DRAFT_200345 [Chaetomium globosum]